jgi:hypothetical protein
LVCHVNGGRRGERVPTEDEWMRVERGTGPWCGSVCEVVGTRRARSAAGLGHGHAFVVSVRVVRAAERREEMEEGDDTVALND